MAAVPVALTRRRLRARVLESLGNAGPRANQPEWVSIRAEYPPGPGGLLVVFVRLEVFLDFPFLVVIVLTVRMRVIGSRGLHGDAHISGGDRNGDARDPVREQTAFGEVRSGELSNHLFRNRLDFRQC